MRFFAPNRVRLSDPRLTSASKRGPPCERKTVSPRSKEGHARSRCSRNKQRASVTLQSNPRALRLRFWTSRLTQPTNAILCPQLFPPRRSTGTSTLGAESFAQIPSAAVSPSFLKDNLFPRSVTSSSDLISVEFSRKSETRALRLALQQRQRCASRESNFRSFKSPFSNPWETPTFVLPKRAHARGIREVELLAISNRLWMGLFTGKVKCVDGDSGRNRRRVDLRTTWRSQSRGGIPQAIRSARGAMRLVAKSERQISS